MLKSSTLSRLLLLVLLLVVMVVPLVGAGSEMVAADSDAVQASVAEEQPAAVIACHTGDPGTSGGGCGGG